MPTDSKDKYGPELVIEVHRPDIGLEGYLVIDNTVRGPGKGGIRMAEGVSREEVERLARAMSLKTALAELPFGGAKSGIRYLRDDFEKKEELFRAFIEAINPYLGGRYVAAPDINTGETEMDWLVEVNGDTAATTGKSVARGGIENKSVATGFGCAVAAEAVVDTLGQAIEGMSVAIDGYGTVGRQAYVELEEKGARVVATSDSRSGIYRSEGFDIEQLDVLKDDRERQLSEYEDSQEISHNDLRILDVDILILSSISDVITEDNYQDVAAKIIIQGANLPIVPGLEKKLHDKGIWIVPDIVANAGGVIASWLEHERPDTGYDDMLAIIREKITKTTCEILRQSRERSEHPRLTAEEIAYERIARNH